MCTAQGLEMNISPPNNYINSNLIQTEPGPAGSLLSLPEMSGNWAKTQQNRAAPGRMDPSLEKWGAGMDGAAEGRHPLRRPWVPLPAAHRERTCPAWESWSPCRLLACWPVGWTAQLWIQMLVGVFHCVFPAAGAGAAPGLSNQQRSLSLGAEKLPTGTLPP